jgi:hypothetical protein
LLRDCKQGLLSKQNKKLIFDSASDVGTFSETFKIKGIEGVTDLSIQTMSVDAKLLRQIEKQKLKMSAGYSVFAGEAGEKEVLQIANTTKRMRAFWKHLSLQLGLTATDRSQTQESSMNMESSPVLEAEFVLKHKDDSVQRLKGFGRGSQRILYAGMRGVNDLELEAMRVSSSKMQRFWKDLEAKQREKNPGMSPAENNLEQISISVDVGLEEGSPEVRPEASDPLSASSDTDVFRKKSPGRLDVFRKKSPGTFVSLNSPQRSKLL